jgi:hypothetical protein
MQHPFSVVYIPHVQHLGSVSLSTALLYDSSAALAVR